MTRPRRWWREGDRTEGNTTQAAATRTQSRPNTLIALDRVREVARRDRHARFTALMLTAALVLVLVSWQWRRAEAKAVAEALAHIKAGASRGGPGMSRTRDGPRASPL